MSDRPHCADRTQGGVGKPGFREASGRQRAAQLLLPVRGGRVARPVERDPGVDGGAHPKIVPCLLSVMCRGRVQHGQPEPLDILRPGIELPAACGILPRDDVDDPRKVPLGDRKRRCLGGPGNGHGRCLSGDLADDLARTLGFRHGPGVCAPPGSPDRRPGRPLQPHDSSTGPDAKHCTGSFRSRARRHRSGRWALSDRESNRPA